jgi:uncharacterized membrane protein
VTESSTQITMSTDSRPSSDDFLGRWHVPEGLGALSLGIGLAALLAPRRVGELIGVRRRPKLIQLIGMRETATGIGLLSGRQSDAWLWSRVAGDLMDLAVLATCQRGASRSRATASTAAVAAIAAVDLAAAIQHSRARLRASAPSDVYIDRTIIVNKSPHECYEFWRDLSNIPRFTRRLKEVAIRENGVSHWVMTIPGGGSVEWDSQLTVERPGERLAWRSLTQQPFSHAGSIQFAAAPGGRGTFVTVGLHYRLPTGVLPAGVTRLLGRDPFGELREDLRRFKQLIETGEIPTTEGQPSGRRSWLGRLIPEGRRSRQPKAAATPLREPQPRDRQHEEARA